MGRLARFGRPGRFGRLARLVAEHGPHGAPPTEAVSAAEPTGREWTRALASLLCAVGVDLLRSGAQTAEAEGTVREIAARYGVAAHCFAVPTGLFVRVGIGPQGHGGELDFAPVEGPDLRLDQVQALHGLLAGRDCSLFAAAH